MEKKGIKEEQVKEEALQNVCFGEVFDNAKTSTMTQRQKKPL